MHQDGREVRLVIRPDAFFALRDSSRPEGKNRLKFFLECAHSTMSHERMEQKIRAYLSTLGKPAPHERHRYVSHPRIKMF